MGQVYEDGQDPEFDEFAGGTGLKANYDGEVVDAYFSSNAQYNNVQLILKIKDLADGTEAEQFYSVGNDSDWGSYDGGETVEHTKGPKTPFNNNSGIQELVLAAFAAGAETEMRRRSREELGGKGAKAAAIWKGLKFHWDAVSKEYTVNDKKTGEKKTGVSTKILPVTAIGVGTVQSSTQSQTPAAATPSESAPTTTAPPQPASDAAPQSSQTPPADGATNPLDLVSPETAAKIKVLATALDYHAWVDQVMTLPGVIDAGTVLITALGDESFYTQLKGS